MTMDNMITVTDTDFKDLEEKCFRRACAAAQAEMAGVLEQLDRQLMEGRDKTQYRHKGLRATTVKTIFGEVTFRRTLYKTKDKDGLVKHVFLLDEALHLDTPGLYSEGFKNLLVSGITTKSYRACAKELSETTGQHISSMGAWNIVQYLGGNLTKEEKKLVSEHDKGTIEGGKVVPVLFEEADGVNISLQGNDRKETKSGKAELKVSIAYEGWKHDGKDRYRLEGKVATAGFEKWRDFQRIREAKIAKEYDTDEVMYRFLNGDGAEWIKKVSDEDTLFQLDVFHRNKAIREKIPHKEAQKTIFKQLNEKNLTEMFSFIEAYRSSLDDPEEIERVNELITYFKNNKAGLLPIMQRGLKLPASPDGIVYRNMGTMEGHVWSMVAYRMKHNHTSWSKSGASNLAKILAKKSEGKLYEVTNKSEFAGDDEEHERSLSAAKVPMSDGKGYEYPVKGSLVALSGPVRGDGKKLLEIAGY